MYGSAWHFKPFALLAMKVFDAEIFRQEMTDYINFEAEEDFFQETTEDIGDEFSDFSDIRPKNSLFF